VADVAAPTTETESHHSDFRDAKRPDSPIRHKAGWGRRLWGYCRRHGGVLTVAAVGAIGGLGLQSVIPLLSRTAVDDATTGHTGNLGWVIGALVALAVIRFGSSFLRRWAGGRLSLDVQHDMRQDVFASLQRLDGAGQDRLRTGQVVSRASTDLQMIQGSLAMVPLSAGQAVMFVISVVLMLTLSPLLTAMSLLVVPGVILLTRATRRVLFPATWSAQQAAADVAEVVEEVVTGVRVVKGFGQEGREISRLRAAARDLYAQRLRAVRITARLTPGLTSLTALGQVGVIALGGYLALHGAISIGTFLAFSLYLGQLVAPARTLSMLLVLGQQARASVERVLEIVDSRADVVDPTDPLPVPDGPLAVDLAGIRFGYLADEPVLAGFDLQVPAGSTIALVGATGSGKSTVSLLLPRFYDPQAGTVAVGGTDVRDLRLADLRRAVGVVFEEAFLFSDSIAANISYGRPEAAPEEIRAAARAAEAADFIEALPDGYQTVIGERGLTLSGGQRQRLALARALLTDPRVLILDDATSAVDPATEAAIHATLKTVTAHRTTILIAHRRSTLDLADRIAVVADGSVVDVGTDAELRGRCALYRTLLGAGLGDTDGAAGPSDTGTALGAGGQGLFARPAGAADTIENTDVPVAADPEPGIPATRRAGSRDGITPSLWPPVGAPAGPSARQVDSSAVAGVGAPRLGGGGAGRGGGGRIGGMVGYLPPTPELLARVEALPPATDTPVADNRDAPDVADAAPFSLRTTLRPVRGLLFLALVLVALDALAGLALPALVRVGVDDGVAKGLMTVVWAASGVALVVVTADFLIQRWQTIAAGKAGESTLYRLRLREFIHLQRLGLDYYEREMAGRIMTRMTTDVDALSSFLQTGLVTSVVSLATFAGIAVMLLVLDPGLALLAYLAIPIVAVATVIFRRYSSRAYSDAREKVSIVNADLQENVAGLRVSQALGREQINAAGFAARSDDYRRSRMRAQTAISIYFPFVAMLADLAAALVLGVGAHRVATGTITAGTLLAFVLYLDSFFTPIQQLSQVFDGYQQAAVGLRRIAGLLATPTSTPAAVDPLPVPPLVGDVRAEAVTFRYQGATDDPAGRPALDDVTIAFPPGRTVAVVGQTGAGKSTLVKLIARFYDVTAGAVTVDGTDVRRFDLTGYRQRLGVVPQEAHLFAGTVRDNIAYGRPDASDATVEAAARAVGALGMIATLPGGFHHAVEERGRNLSAGQRQLVSLARAELVDPDILLLDEATAALDPASEAAVLAATDRLSRGRTTIVVAHRLTTASRADLIVVMDHGRVAETGTHDELLAAAGVYAGLYAQAQAAPEPPDAPVVA
jgi:ATP-binding cassette subfamily B protein